MGLRLQRQHRSGVFVYTVFSNSTTFTNINVVYICKKQLCKLEITFIKGKKACIDLRTTHACYILNTFNKSPNIFIIINGTINRISVNQTYCRVAFPNVHDVVAANCLHP